MKMASKKFLIAFVALGSLFTLGLTANAECGFYQPPAMHPDSYQPLNAAPQFLTVDDGEQPTIVGQWKEHWISKGNLASLGIPDGVEIDTAYSQWHADGTEWSVSGLRPPNTGDVCMGVWKKIGPMTYKLNHFGVSYNPNNTLLGLARIQQTITLDATGTKISGTFSIDQYNESGVILAHIQGTVYGNRVTVDTGWQKVE